MYLIHFSLAALLTLTTTVSAHIHPHAQVARGNKCPPVWLEVKAELNVLFTTNGPGTQCNDLARAAIRASFHDCGSWDLTQGFHGGCDGSLFVGVNPDVELDRSENKGLQKIAPVIVGLAAKYGTSVADMIVFAGNSATYICPHGPFIQTFIGRKDNTTSAPVGGLPDVHDSAVNLMALFSAKGFKPADLAAMLGAHSTSTQFFVDGAKANQSQDSTPGVWDVKYYQETRDYVKTGKKPANIFILPSDIALAGDPVVGPKFHSFVGSPNSWEKKYRSAMSKMTLFGNDVKGMADCTRATQAE